MNLKIKNIIKNIIKKLIININSYLSSITTKNGNDKPFKTFKPFTSVAH